MPALYNTLPARHSALADLMCAAAAAALALAGMGGCGSGEPARPNVLLVVIESTRADHVSAYGYARATTPAIDALAASGTLYENAIATAPWGLTAHASILTGLHPTEHAAVFDHPVLEESLETLAERLRKNGYATFAVSTDSRVNRQAGFAQGFDSFVGIDGAESPDSGAAAAEGALAAWIEGKGTAKPGEGSAPRSKDAPFYAHLVLANPQLPFGPPGEYAQKFLEKPIPLPRLEALSQYWLPFARRFTLGLEALSPEEQAAMAALYDGEVGYADFRVGRILESLRAKDLLDTTLVVVTSDVGEDLMDHGLLSDASNVYDSIIKVPLVFRLPGKIKEQQRVQDQVQTLDIMEAILTLTAPPAEGQAGTAAAMAHPMKPKPVAICEARLDPGALIYYRSLLPREDLSILERNLVAARTLEYKYILNSRGTAALFDLKADPAERSSVLANQPEKAQALAQSINSWAGSLRPPPGYTASATPAGPAPAPAGSPPAAPSPAGQATPR